MRDSFRTSLVVFTLAAAAAAQNAWIQLQPGTNPPARGQTHVVSLDLQGKCLLYGGEVMNPGGATLGDTWTWNGSTWLQESPAQSPGLLEGHAMAYDLVRDRAVLFSGWDGNVYPSQTWEWDGTTWSQAAGVQPPGRDWSAMAYDPARMNTVLFGGHDWQVTGGKLGDTWTFDGTTWTQHMVSGPSVRWGHAMAFDPTRNSVILFGGQDAVGNETWEWSGATWTQLSPATTPPPRRWHRMAYDPSRNRLVMVGGEWGGAQLSDVWEWDGTDWQQATTVGGPPAGKSSFGFAYDTVTQALLHHGGHSMPDRAAGSDETWVLRAGASGFATWGTYGTGCGEGDPATFYEQFTSGAPFDLASSGFLMLASGSSYTVLPAINPIVTPTGAATTFGDDNTQQITLPWPMVLPDGTTTTDIWVCSNGFIALEPTSVTDFTESVGELLSGPRRLCALWDDLNPSAGGTIHAEVDATNPALFHVTFTNVPEWPSAGSNTFQVSFDPAGGMEVKYGAISLSDALVGYSDGSGAPDPGGLDLSAVLPNVIQLGNGLPALALRSQGGARPVVGTTFVLEITGVPLTATAAALLFSTTKLDPGVDLTAAGFGGCSLFVGSGFDAGVPLGVPTAQLGLPLPVGSTLAGTALLVQGAVLGVPNVSPLPAGFTNGGEMRIDVN